MIARPGKLISVMLSEPVAGTVRNFVACPPVTYVHVAADGDWTTESEARPRHNGKIYAAMIDTGADGIFLRQEIAADIDAELTGNGVISGFGESQAGARRARIQIIFPQPDVIFLARGAAVTQFHGDRRSFDLVLGRQLLEYCRLLVDGPNGSYRMEWIGQGRPSRR
jgi:hypothetical protein